MHLIRHRHDVPRRITFSSIDPSASRFSQEDGFTGEEPCEVEAGQSERNFAVFIVICNKWSSRYLAIAFPTPGPNKNVLS